jgi:hypothetical protein
VRRLKDLETSPWADWNHGKGITTNGVSRLLRNYKIRPRNIRVGDKVSKGYLTEQFGDAWSRYLPPPTPFPGFEPLQPLQTNNDAAQTHFSKPLQDHDVAVEKSGPDPHEQRIVAAVAVQTGAKGNGQAVTPVGRAKVCSACGTLALDVWPDDSATCSHCHAHKPALVSSNGGLR